MNGMTHLCRKRNVVICSTIKVYVLILKKVDENTGAFCFFWEENQSDSLLGTTVCPFH